ncbi:putative proteolysis and peptidolysis-related protein [Clavulina sp. PMI_390]|nr:putative proteolysis and peptidolysis-related protein [Clavulina sp. PMI_390]
MSTLSIHNAAQQNQASLVRSLLTANASLLNAKDADGRTPLHTAASTGSLDSTRYLLDQKADVNARDEMGWTPLMIAAANDKGITALHYAASKGRVQIGRTLINRGADINAKDRANQHPLHRAATTNSSAFVSLLLSPPAELKLPKTRLNTADRVAMESGHGDVAILLIEAGADRNRTNEDGLEPEQMEGVGGVEQKRLKDYIVSRCGPP